MRIVQIIDSLEIGGAEKMAVNYANALANEIAFSGLIATRNEGDLKSRINTNVHYLFLKKKKTLDLSAANRLKQYYKNNNIDFVHSHASSYFITLLAKIMYPKMKIIWHDHNGLSEFVTKQKNTVIQIASLFFSGIIVVNYQLKNWAETKLNCKKVIYLPNFTEVKENMPPETFLKGNQGKRILCLANLRPQKNHFLLLEVAQKCKADFPDWTFHLVGKDFEDEYSTIIKNRIVDNDLQKTVFIYGSKNDVANIINQCEISVFTSNSEGLPVALIEFGLCKKAVLSTAVGEIPLVIDHEKNGFIVEANDAQSFYDYLIKLINDSTLRADLGNALFEKVVRNNAQGAVIKRYLNWLVNNNDEN
jgi:glycosyltransferase involved in cell wall biosynthesis